MHTEASLSLAVPSFSPRDLGGHLTWVSLPPHLELSDMLSASGGGSVTYPSCLDTPGAFAEKVWVALGTPQRKSVNPLKAAGVEAFTGAGPCPCLAWVRTVRSLGSKCKS